MSIAADYGEQSATFAVRPECGKPVTFVVTERSVNVSRSRTWYSPPARMAARFVVGLKGSDGAGFSDHTSFEAACKAALLRARRYDTAFGQTRSGRAA